MGRALRRLTGTLLESRYQRAIAVSPAAARFAALAWRGPITIIPNGVSTAVYSAPVAAAHPTSAGALRLLFVGAFADPRKGLRYLLEAVAQLRARGLALVRQEYLAAVAARR